MKKTTRSIPKGVKDKFYETLEKFKNAQPLLAANHKKKLLSSLDNLTDSKEGLQFLYENIEDLAASGIFNDTMWDDPTRLVPSLVGGTLKAGGQNTIVEIVSELRIVGLANGTITHDTFTPENAHTFLKNALVNNLDLIFPDSSEESRSLEPATAKKIEALFDFLTDEIPIANIKGELATEIELICAQRPIVTDRVLEIIETVNNEIQLSPEDEEDRKLLTYIGAVYSPSDKAEELTPEAYKNYLATAGREEIIRECEALSKTMTKTGLATTYHALLLRQTAGNVNLVKRALDLDDIGEAELEKHSDFVTELIRTVIYPDTSRSCYGFAKLLERSLLSHQPVKSGLKRIMGMEMHPDVETNIRKSRNKSSLDPKYILTAECLGVLGQPLGVGQGWNPTCQSARGISLWSSHAPGKLLRMIESAAKSNSLEMRFEGDIITSKDLIAGLVKELDYNLDAVSVVLVPHLDKIYNEMMRRASNRQDDPHKWVNPAMYGHWIPTGFISAYNALTNTIQEYEKFLRIFYVTHHPDYNGGNNLAYPNPVGIFLTSSTGKLIGFHAVSILRVKKFNSQVRVYMLNPNNEGRQRWQDDMRPTVAGNGERAGESSLPFHQFASRLYAFHFNRSDVDKLERVDAKKVEKVTQMAKQSWGESYQWTEPAGHIL